MEGFIYILKWRTIYKIGCTNNLERRTKANLIKKPDCKLIYAFKCNNYEITEKIVHNYFDKYRVCGNNEWFSFEKKEVKKELLCFFEERKNLFARVI